MHLHCKAMHLQSAWVKRAKPLQLPMSYRQLLVQGSVP